MPRRYVLRLGNQLETLFARPGSRKALFVWNITQSGKPFEDWIDPAIERYIDWARR
jgi:hypothetical protein